MPALSVTTLDLTILIVYVLGSRLIFGWYIVRKRRKGDTEACFLGGETFTGLLSVFPSMFPT